MPLDASSRRRHTKPTRQQKKNLQRRRAAFEQLEQRNLLATWANNLADADANWTTPTNWVDGVVPAPGEIAVFPASATIELPVIPTNVSIAGIQIDNSGADYSISGVGTLSIGASGINVSSPTSATANTSTITAPIALDADQSWTVTNNGANVSALSVTSTISGTSTLTKADSGTLSLSGANTSFTGKTVINGGVVSVSVDTNLGAAPAAAVADQLTLNGGTIQLTGAASNNLNINRGITLGTLGGTISNAGMANGLTTVINPIIAGNGPLTLAANGDTSDTGGSSSGRFTLNNSSNSFTGAVNITSGIVDFASDSAFGNAANTITITTTSRAGLLVTSTKSLGRSVVLATSSTGFGIFRLYGSATLTMTGTISGTGNLRRTDGGVLLLNGNLTHTGNLYSSAGTTALAGAANTYTGYTQLTGGSTLRLDANNVIPDTSDILQYANTIFNVNGRTETIRALTVGSAGDANATTNLGTNGNLTVRGNNFPGLPTQGNVGALYYGKFTGTGNITYDHATSSTALWDIMNATNDFVGNWIITNGRLRFPSDAQIGNAANDIIFNGTPNATLSSGSGTASLQVQSSAALNLGSGRDIILNAGKEGTLYVWGSTTTTINGKVTGSGNLRKEDVGTLVLANAANDYTGSTLNIAGTIQLGAAALGAGPLTNNSTLNLNGNNAAVSRLTGSGTITDSSAVAGTSILTVNAASGQTYSGVINDGATRSLALVVNNPSATGDLILTGASNFSGGTTLNSGRIRPEASTVGAPGSITTGPLGRGLVTVNSTSTGTNTGGQLFVSAPVTLANAFAIAGRSGESFGALRFDQSATLSGPIELTGNARIGNANNNPVLTLTGPVSGAFALEVNRGNTGTFTVVLNNATATPHSWSGGTTINSNAIVRLDAANQIPDAGNVTVNGTLNLNTFSETISGLSGSGTVDTIAGGTPTLTVNADAATTTTFNGVITDTAGALAINKVGAGELVLNGANTFSGGTTVTAGDLTAIGNQAGNRLLAGSTVTINGGRFVYGATNALPTSTNTPTFIINSSGALHFVGGSGFHAHLNNVTMSGGQITTAGTGNYNGEDFSLNGTITVTGSAPSTIQLTNGIGMNGTRPFNVADVTGDANPDLTISGTGDMQNGGALQKTGAGTMVLNNQNTYTGGTFVDGGVLRAIGGQQNNRIANNTTVTINNGGTFEYGEVNVVPGTVDYVVNNGGTLKFVNTTGAAGFHAHTRNLTLNGGSMALVDGLTADGYNGEAVQIDGNIIVGGSTPSTIVLQSGNRGGMSFNGIKTITVADATGDAAADLIVIGELEDRDAGAGSSGINKLGPGTMLISNTTSYSGTTTVSEGTLLVNGSLANGPAAVDVTVLSGATLGGSGVINGTVSVASGGHLSPGNSPGALSIADLVLASGADFDVDIWGAAVGTGYDQTTVTGSVNLGGADLNLNFGSGPYTPTAGQTFVLINNTSTNAVVGTFGNLGGAQFVSGGIRFGIRYDADATNVNGTGNDVVLYVLPALAAPTTLYVNDNWSSSPAFTPVDGNLEAAGTQSAYTGYDAFASIADALAAYPSFAGTIVVNGGVYGTADLTGGGAVSLQLVRDTVAGQNAVTVTTLSGSNNDTVTFTGGTATSVGATDGLFAGVISGAGGLSKSGSGTLILTGANTYTGATSITAGTLQLGNGSNTGSLAASSAVTITSPGTLAYFRSDSAGEFVIGHSVSGNGNWTFNSPGGTLVGRYQLTGNNSGFSGSLGISSSRLNVNNVNQLGTATIAIHPGGQLLAIGITASNALTLNSTGWPETAGNFGALRLSNSTWTGAITLAGDSAIGNAGGENGTISGAIGGTGNLAFVNTQGSASNITLSGATSNTYVGTTTVAANARLILSKTGGAVAIPGNVNFGSGSNTINPYIRATQSNQFGANSVVTFLNAIGGFTRLELQGTTQTLAGISDVLGAGVIQNSESGVGGNGVLVINNTADFAYNGYLRNGSAGTTAVIKSGSGTQTFSGAQIIYNGLTTVNEGTLRFASANVGRGALTINNGGTFLSAFGNAIDAMTGPFTINAGGLMTKDAGPDNINGQLILNGGTLGATVAGHFTYGNWVLNYNTAPGIVVGGTSTSTIAADVRVGNNQDRIFQVADTGDASGIDLDVTGKVGHLNNATWGYITKTGAGTMQLSNVNNQMGRLTVSEGMVKFKDNMAGMSNGGLINNATVEADVSGTALYPYLLTGSGTFNKTGAGTLQFSGGNQVISTSGQFNIQQGKLQNNNNTVNWSNNTADMDISAGAILDLYADPIFVNRLTGQGTVTNNFGNGANYSGSGIYTERLTVGVNGGSSTFAGTITNSAGGGNGANGGRLELQKVGSGEFTLTSANTYIGGTLVNGGVLLANNTTGSATGTGGVTVASTGTLGGNGTMSGNVLVNGVLAPGATFSPASIGTLTIGGTLTLAAGSTYQAVVTSSADDRVNANSIVINSGANLDVTVEAGLGAGNTNIILDAVTSATGQFATGSANATYPIDRLLTVNSSEIYHLTNGDPGNRFASVAATEVALVRNSTFVIDPTATFTTNEDTALSYDLVTTDIDQDVTITINPASVDSLRGTVTVNQTTGVITYTPALDFSGTATFEYTVTDGEYSFGPTTVTVTVTPVADTPDLTVNGQLNPSGVINVTMTENTALPLPIVAALTDNNPLEYAEILTVTISGLHPSAVFTVGSQVHSGLTSYTFGGAQLADLASATLLLPDNLFGNAPFTLTVTATATEGPLPSTITASRSASVQVTVTNTAPTPEQVEILLNGVSATVLAGNQVDITPGTPVTFQVRASDLVANNQDGPYRFTVRWTPTVVQTVDVANPEDILDFTYDFAGLTPPSSFTPTLTVRELDVGNDINGDALSTTISLTRINLSNIVQIGDTLYVGGTTNADRIIVQPAIGGISVRFNNALSRTYQISERVVVYGNAGNDTISVSGDLGVPVELYGGAGNDYLAGGNYDDILDGGDGTDRLLAGSGNDTLYGGPGNDTLAGGLGNDTVYGDSYLDLTGAIVTPAVSQQGKDTISGEGGDDILYGEGNVDTLNGGLGSDILRGGEGNDTLSGDDGDDILSGDLGADKLYGRAGNDVLIGGGGLDTLYGGAGDDLLFGNQLDDLTADDNSLLEAIAGDWFGITGTKADAVQKIDLATRSAETAVDMLYGEAGTDWYLLYFGDKVASSSEKAPANTIQTLTPNA